MRRHDRLVPVVALLAVAIVLTGCHTPSRLGVSTTVAPVTGTCDTSAVVEVGAALSLSGPEASQGRAELTGLKLAVDQVNRAGGVLSSHRCLELLYKDNRSVPAVDNQAILDLVNQEHVSLVVGPFLALEDAEGRAHLGSLGVTAATFSAVEDAYRPDAFPDTFSLGAPSSVDADILAAQTLRQHWQRVAIVSSGSLASVQAMEAFLHATRAGRVVTTPGLRLVDSRSSAMAALTAAATAHAQAVIVFDDGETLAPVLSARRALGLTLPVAVSAVGKLPLVSRSSLNGVELVVPSALVVSSAVSVNLASFRSQVLHALHQRSVQGTLAPYAAAYDAIELFASAATGANADDDNSIRTYLENASYQGLLGSYSYSSTAHTGLGASQMALVPMSELSNGLFVKATRAG